MKQTLLDTAYIKVSPPLPCVVTGLGAGFVESLAPGRLLLRLVTPAAAMPAGKADITISPQPTLTYTFSADFTAVNPASEAQAPLLEAQISPAGQAAMTDLLTLIRKEQHIAICASTDVEASDRYTGFADLNLVPCALPELALEDLDTRRTFLGHTFSLPLLITGMTGGLERGAEINRRLALAAQHFGIPMGVGSQRLALENPEHAEIFAVKKHAPRVFLLANVGIAQLGRSIDRSACLRAIEMIEADALAIHVNILQEMVQVEGDRDFRGLLDSLAEIAASMPVPVLVKEVGGGIDPQTAEALIQRGLRALDIGGKGGTSWSLIEGLRAQSPVTQAVAHTFRDWGIPTALGVYAIRKLCPGQLDLVATGGVRDGLMAAKALALGATMVGIGLPLFRAALNSPEEPFLVLETLSQGLKTAMMCTGARNIDALSQRLHIAKAFKEQLARLTPNM